MATRPSLHRRLLQWVAGYGLLLTACVFVHGVLVNEFAERLLWDSLLQTEFQHYRERRASETGYRWTDTDSLQLYADGGADGLPPPPRAVASLVDGIHDEYVLGDREVLVLRQPHDGERYTMVLDITELEAREDTLTAMMIGSALVVTVLLCLLIAYGLRRALRPLGALAQSISALHPDRRGQRLPDDPAASAELEVIAGSLNDYLARNDRFVERERAFIDSASHELRTPVAVIANAAELAGETPGLPPQVAQRLSAIRRTTRDMERLITLLLVLAKDPARLAQASDRIALDELLPEIVDDYRVLADAKGVSLALAPTPPCTIVAPVQVVQAAIGNLLRNAIEHSGAGTITVRLQADAVVEIADPGPGMSPEQVSTIYARMARGDAATRDGGGIGLDLIARLCDHLGWRLDFDAAPDEGTVARLALR